MVFTSIDAFVSIVTCVNLTFLNSKILPKESICLSSNDVLSAVPAVLDMLANSPALVSQQTVVASLLGFYHHYVPFAALGLGWSSQHCLVTLAACSLLCISRIRI